MSAFGRTDRVKASTVNGALSSPDSAHKRANIKSTDCWNKTFKDTQRSTPLLSFLSVTLPLCFSKQTQLSSPATEVCMIVSSFHFQRHGKQDSIPSRLKALTLKQHEASSPREDEARLHRFGLLVWLSKFAPTGFMMPLSGSGSSRAAGKNAYFRPET